MMDVNEHKEDIQAIREAVNLLNMIVDTGINKVVAFIDIAGDIGVYKTDIKQYTLGIASILVNRRTHEVYGFYGKIISIPDENILIGAKLDLATNTIVIEVIDSNGTVIKSITTDKNINSYCSIDRDFVTIGSDKYTLN